MFTNVVVGVDRHQGGRDAIALAKRLVEPSGRLTLAFVQAGKRVTRSAPRAALDAAEREQALELLATARDQAEVEAQLRGVGARSAGRGLHLLAEAAGADLLVVGSSRRALLGRVLLGDGTHAALNGAPHAVAIAPAGYSRDPGLMREIGVGYDGSPESEHALAVARVLSRRHGARLSAFEAVSLPAESVSGGAAPAGAIEDSVKNARDRIAALGDVEPHAAYGEPAEELALYSASLDLLVVGSRDYGPLGRLIHGSTSQQLARTARCPLLVLPRTVPAAETLDVVEQDGGAARVEAIEQPPGEAEPSRHAGRRSSSVDTAAARWGITHPEEDTEHPAPPSVPEDEGVVPNRHSASAEAAALRWREQHEDDDS
jgi:nucleotide-binding universal stress UspA family protein